MCDFISDEKTKARKPYFCFICCDEIEVGTLHRVSRFKEGEEFWTNREHLGCAAFMQDASDGMYAPGKILEFLCDYREEDIVAACASAGEEETNRVLALKRKLDEEEAAWGDPIDADVVKFDTPDGRPVVDGDKLRDWLCADVAVCHGPDNEEDKEGRDE